MSEKELLDALTVLARRLGLIGRRQVLRIDEADPPAAEMCLLAGEYKGARLLCTFDRGHPAVSHSWSRAMVGMSPCTATSGLIRHASTDLLCERPTHHTGEHKATGADGVRWTWGDAPRTEETGKSGTVCGRPSVADTAYACVLRAGHEGLCSYGVAGVFTDPTTERA